MMVMERRDAKGYLGSQAVNCVRPATETQRVSAPIVIEFASDAEVEVIREKTLNDNKASILLLAKK